ncbi:MAG: hypothetical protein LC642_07955, partial [Verrucomicrobiaceae bacterium]|nr:hypothetical protein [Verrucomicrobiaceae bacterium]
STLRYCEPEFMEIGGRWVLLPVPREHHTNITVLRTITGDDGAALLAFLKDKTFVEDPAQEWFRAGFVAVCERLPGEQFYLATLYHEWFINDEASK